MFLQYFLVGQKRSVRTLRFLPHRLSADSRTPLASNWSQQLVVAAKKTLGESRCQQGTAFCNVLCVQCAVSLHSKLRVVRMDDGLSPDQ